MKKLFFMLTTLLLSSLAVADDSVDFFRAVQIDNDVAVRRLLAEKRVNPNALEPGRREPALVIAAREDAARVADVLLANPAVNINAQAANGDTAIMIAAYKGNYEMVRALLGREAQVNRPGWTALHYAASGGHREIVLLLLEKSAYIDAESPNKTTPLMMAARDGHVGVIKVLMDEGADPALKNSQGMTAYDFAVYYQQKDAAAILKGATRHQ